MALVPDHARLPGPQTAWCNSDPVSSRSAELRAGCYRHVELAEPDHLTLGLVVYRSSGGKTPGLPIAHLTSFHDGGNVPGTERRDTDSGL